MSDKGRKCGEAPGAEGPAGSCCCPGEMPNMMRGRGRDGVPKAMRRMSPDDMFKVMQECCREGTGSCDCEAMIREMFGGTSDKPEDQ